MRRVLILTAWLVYSLTGVLLATYAPRSWRCGAKYVIATLFSANTWMRVAVNDDKLTWELGTISSSQALQHFPVLDKVISLALSPDGKTLLTGSTDGIVRLWDVKTGTLLHTLSLDRTYAVEGLALSPDGKTLLTGSAINTAKLWDVKTGSLLHTLTGHTSWVSSVAFAPDGKTLLTGSADGTAKLWDVKTGSLLHTLTGHTSWVYSVAFAPNSKTLLTGSTDHTAILWDAQSGALLHTLSGHTNWLTNVDYVPDGKTLLTASRDGVAILWDAQSGALIRPLCPLALGQAWYIAGIAICITSGLAALWFVRRVWQSSTSALHDHACV